MNKTLTIIAATVIAATVLTLTACGKNEPAETFPPRPIERIDLALTAYGEGDTTALDAMHPGLDLYVAMMSPGAPADSAVNILVKSPVMTVFGRDIAERFDMAEPLAAPLGHAIGQLQQELPDIRVSHIYGIASPYMQSVVVSDSIVMVALNHYLGSDYPGYSSMPSYLTRFKTPAQIIPDVVEALVRVNYPFKPADGTLLERMLYEGAVARAVNEVCDENDAVGMTNDEYVTVKSYEHDLWTALAAEKLLYASAQLYAGRLLDPSAGVRVGNLELPGRALRVTSLGIIDSYMRNNEETNLPTLLSPDFYNTPRERLIESRYNP